jgi:hypothetical protein
MPKRKQSSQKQLCVRVSHETYAEWSRDAAAAGITVSTLIRLRMAGREVIETRKAA